MAATSTLAHNAAAPSQVANWRAFGENVGKGTSVSIIQSSFIASPVHLANLLSGQFTEVGYGTAVAADGALYVDEVFRTPAGAGCGAPGAAPPAAPVETPVQAVPPALPPAQAVRPSIPPVAGPTAPEQDPVATAPPAPPIAPDPTVAIERLSRPAPPLPAEDSIGRAFGFLQTFAAAVQS